MKPVYDIFICKVCGEIKGGAGRMSHKACVKILQERAQKDKKQPLPNTKLTAKSVNFLSKIDK